MIKKKLFNLTFALNWKSFNVSIKKLLSIYCLPCNIYLILIIQLYQSYENIDFFKKRFHLYFSSLEAYTTVLRGIVGWFYLIKLHKYVLTLEILKCVYDRIVYLNILFQKRVLTGVTMLSRGCTKFFFARYPPSNPLHKCFRTPLVHISAR